MVGFECKDFFDTLKENIDSYSGEHEDIIHQGPKLFRFLTDLLEDERIKKEERLIINSAIAYFVSPHDVIPESLCGPIGYMDDIFLSVFVIKEIRNRAGIEVLNDNWIKEGELEPLVSEILKTSYEVIGEEKAKEVLRYAGLSE